MGFKIAVAGATGNVGREMLNILSERGFPADEVVTQGAYSLAFAGVGTLSLKEALDAAHGHEHAADGSELTAEQKVGKQTTGAAGAHEHAPGHGHEHQSPFWMIVSGVLLVLLVVVGLMKRPRELSAKPRE